MVARARATGEKNTQPMQKVPAVTYRRMGLIPLKVIKAPFFDSSGLPVKADYRPGIENDSDVRAVITYREDDDEFCIVKVVNGMLVESTSIDTPELQISQKGEARIIASVDYRTPGDAGKNVHLDNLDQPEFSVSFDPGVTEQTIQDNRVRSVYNFEPARGLGIHRAA
ncbi:MAG: hypothetical protein OXU45_01830 [Candidatus Melainabacteria bacterium]|nr:hypothetical protein [Candidatus Melainabacteria bacterium]